MPKKDKRIREPVNVARILSSHTLAKLYDETQLLSELQKIVRASPYQVTNDLRVTSYRHKRLTLATDSQAQTTRIRFILPNLKSYLRTNSAFTQLAEIRLIVSLGRQQQTPPTEVPRKVPTEAATGFKPLADNVTNPKLRQALQRLTEYTNIR